MDVRDAGIERFESEQFRGTILNCEISFSLSLSRGSFLILIKRPPKALWDDALRSSRGISLLGRAHFLGARKSFLSLSRDRAS